MTTGSTTGVYTVRRRRCFAAGVPATSGWARIAANTLLPHQFSKRHLLCGIFFTTPDPIVFRGQQSRRHLKPSPCYLKNAFPQEKAIKNRRYCRFQCARDQTALPASEFRLQSSFKSGLDSGGSHGMAQVFRIFERPAIATIDEIR